MYLVDTCIWIDLLRGRDNQYVAFLEKLLRNGDAVINEVIFSELCFGAANKKQFEKYKTYFSKLPFMKLSENWYLDASQMGYSLRMNGFKPYVPDILIALAAIKGNYTLLTSDNDFEPMGKLFALKIKNFKEGA